MNISIGGYIMMLNIVGVITPENMPKLIAAIAICSVVVMTTWFLKRRAKQS